MGYNDAPQPGGWLGLFNLRVKKKVVVSTAALAAASVIIYGSLQGREASLYAEAELDPATKSGAQTAQWAWPRSDTGVILADDLSYAFFEEVPAPASRLLIGVGDSGSTGATIDTTVAEITPVAGDVFTLRGSGAVALPNKVFVGPGKYVTFSWYNGSGAVTGDAAGIARIKVEPCGNDDYTCG